mmetsp:Transcript_39112/g.93892  ORF Transcript_39112/g.93892 Transcript_39112/m.93892 type:complete len:121 (-) Transcript_39112:16-378(-)
MPGILSCVCTVILALLAISVVHGLRHPGPLALRMAWLRGGSAAMVAIARAFGVFSCVRVVWCCGLNRATCTLGWSWTRLAPTVMVARVAASSVHVLVWCGVVLVALPSITERGCVLDAPN